MKKKLGMKLSGGADSAIVYYKLCKEFSDADIYILTLGTDEKPYYPMLAKRVVEKVYELTGVRPVKHITNFIEHSDEGYVVGQEEMADILRNKYKVEDIYSGISSNPPIEDMLEYFEHNHNLNLEEVKFHIEKRDKERDLLPESSARKGAPFTLLSKRDVAMVYNEEKVLDELYPNTCSCESPSGEDEDGYPIHCGTCFFCLERWYGFGRII